MKYKIIFLIAILLIFPITISAQRGCCSWHGGVSYCGNNGYYICNDGTQSPSCTCYNANNNYNNGDDLGIKLTDTSNNCSFEEEQIQTLEKETDELDYKISMLEKNNEDLKGKLEGYKWAAIVFGILLIIISFAKFSD